MLILAACGDEVQPGSADPTLEPAVTEPAAESSPAVGGGATGNASNESESGELTLGELADRVNVRLSELTAFREVSVATTGGSGQPADAASPSASTMTEQRITREVISPDRAHLTIEVNGDVVDEQIVTGDLVFSRGILAQLLDPTATQDEWIAADLATIGSHPALGDVVTAQLRGDTPARYAVPERLTPQTVRPLGEIDVAGTSCQAYGAADTTATGARIDIAIAIDADDRLCAITVTSSGISGRYTVEELPEDYEIEAPATARPIATPAASPAAGGTPASAATPGAATPIATP